ncbi:GTP-binding protein [Cellvibrio sp. pealriver]|uniref:GTP-binding protein n=1 Tax=Cellvibrio sp. pealriver TaxID=1622269 RepID=UPI0009E3071E|nr:GTP-binding protein [Cellvibrio sp. pealriver]
MKYWIYTLSLFGTLLGSLPASAQHSLEQLWQTPDLPTPESVLYVADKNDPYLFVSLIDGEGNVADGKGGIAKLATDGSVIEKEWLVGLDAPKGMAIFEGRLYVADITTVAVIDIKEQTLLKKIPIEGAVFLNDVTINSTGVVYVSDTRTNKVHRIIDDVPSLYLENVANANGLKAFGPSLVVGAGPELLLFGADKKPLVLAKGFAQGIDGIEMLAKRGEFIVSCWPGLVYYVSGDGKIQVLIDSQAQKINTADIGYDPNTNQVFVPNFFKNTVTAYQLD